MDEKALEAATRAYLRELDIDPDLPHGLKPGAEVWWKVEAPRLRLAIEAYDSARPKGDVGELVERLREHAIGYQSHVVGKLLTRAADALSASVEGWRDISTAPKDGMEFIGYEEGNAVAEMQWEVYPSDVAAEIGEEGYWCYTVAIMSDVLEPPIPTHWQPLPAPPPPPKERT